jgi:hypothetical protein
LRLTGKKAEQYPDAVKRLALSIEVKDKERLSGKLAGKHK